MQAKPKVARSLHLLDVIDDRSRDDQNHVRTIQNPLEIGSLTNHLGHIPFLLLLVPAAILDFVLHLCGSVR